MEIGEIVKYVINNYDKFDWKKIDNKEMLLTEDNIIYGVCLHSPHHAKRQYVVKEDERRYSEALYITVIHSLVLDNTNFCLEYYPLEDSVPYRHVAFGGEYNKLFYDIVHFVEKQKEAEKQLEKLYISLKKKEFEDKITNILVNVVEDKNGQQ